MGPLRRRSLSYHVTWLCVIWHLFSVGEFLDSYGDVHLIQLLLSSDTDESAYSITKSSKLAALSSPSGVPVYTGCSICTPVTCMEQNTSVWRAVLITILIYVHNCRLTLYWDWTEPVVSSDKLVLHSLGTRVGYTSGTFFYPSLVSPAPLKIPTQPSFQGPVRTTWSNSEHETLTRADRAVHVLPVIPFSGVFCVNTGAVFCHIEFSSVTSRSVCEPSAKVTTCQVSRSPVIASIQSTVNFSLLLLSRLMLKSVLPQQCIHRLALPMTEAHGGLSMESPVGSDSYNSYCASDDHVAKAIRERLREYRRTIVGSLQEKLTSTFIQQLLTLKLITATETDQVQRKQRRAQRASCLVDIISRKRGTDLKVFVDQLKTHCPKAHNILHVPGYGQDASVSDMRTKVPTQSLVETIDTATRKAAEKLEACLSDQHFGVHVFSRELKSVLNSGVDIALVTFDSGTTLMHEIVKLDRVEYLSALQYAGCWNKLFNLRTDSSLSPVTPTELAKQLKKTKMVTALAQINVAERTVDNVSKCVRAGDVSQFRQLKMNRQYSAQHYQVVSGQVSLLEYACQSGQLPMLFEVIRMEQDLGYRRDSIDKAMALCVDLGHHLLFQPLIDYSSVDISRVIVDGKSLTDRSAINGDIETFRELERLGAQTSDTVIALAAAQNRLPFLHEIFRNFRTYNINFQDRRKKSAAHFAAEKGNAEIVRLLLEQGIDVTLKDKRNFSILHAAVNGGDLETVKAVLEVGEQRGILDSMLTARDRYLGAERCFLVRGRDNEQPAWHYVEADRALIDIFRRRTQGGAVDVASYGTVLKSGWGTAPSQDVIQEVEGMYDVVNARSDALPDQQPLHVAVMKNHEMVALTLISMMDDVGQPDCFGLTPLHLAAMRGNVAVIEALLAKGANRDVVDSKRRTPLDIAEANEQLTAVTTLTPTGQNDTEMLRQQLLNLYQDLSKDKLRKCRERGVEEKQHMKALLREMVADINDFLYDSLGEGPIATETGMAGSQQSAASFF